MSIFLADEFFNGFIRIVKCRFYLSSSIFITIFPNWVYRPAILFIFPFSIRALGGDPLRQDDWQEGDQDDEHGHYIGDRSIAWPGELGEDPDWQCGLLTRGKCGNDDFVK